MKKRLICLALALIATTPLHAEVAQQAYLKASNTEAGPTGNPLYEAVAASIAQGYDPGLDFGEIFGHSVAVSGDTIVVGAPQENSGDPTDEADNSALYAGAAYVFVRIGTSWFQQAYLKPSQAPQAASFGKSVAISGDTIIIGAPSESSNATGINGDEADLSAGQSGAAFIFIRNGTSWSQQAYLKASNAEVSDAFGECVAIDGDTAVVGAPAEDSAATGPGGDQNDNTAENSGAVYVFSRSGTTWSQQRYLKPSNTESEDRFGSTVSVSGDTIAVGAPEEDSASTGIGGAQNNNTAENSGAVYVFRRLGVSTWVQQAYIKASNAEGGSGFFSTTDRFGTCVSLDGNLLAVGAPGESSAATGIGGDQSDNSADESGAVYIFSRNVTTWSQDAYVKASNTGHDDKFGSSISLSGSTLVVGTPEEDGISTGVDGDDSAGVAYRAGACYVFEKPAATWIQSHYLKPSYLSDVPVESQAGGIDLSGLTGTPSSNSDLESINSTIEFGSAVAVDGTVVAVGAPFENSDARGIDGDQTNIDAPHSGAAYAFDLDAQPPVPQADIAVQFPVGRDLVSQFSEVDFGLAAAGQSIVLEFAIANAGGADLTGITIKTIGPNAADFTPSVTSITSIAPDGNVTFDLTFSPTGGGVRQATLCINSNDPDEAPFTVELDAVAVSQSSDQDGDGMGDLAEFALRRLGFDWQKRQSGLVEYYYAQAEAAGLYDENQIGTLYAPSPILSRDASSGKFKLNIDWKISEDVNTFSDFPASAPQVSVNPAGDIEFEFDAPGARAFFQVLIGE